MTPAARYAAAIDILDIWLSGAPVEKALTGWARRSRYAGSKDRAAIRDIVFDCVRSKRSFAITGGSVSGRGLVLGSIASQGIDPKVFFTGEGYGAATLTAAELEVLANPVVVQGTDAFDIPDWLEPDLAQALGDDLSAVMDVLRQRAPTFLRTNLSRGSRDDLIKTLAEDDILAHASALCETAIEVTQNPRKLRQSKALAAGLADFQDAASQAICADIAMTSSAQILDYCAGGGGKALALADRLKIADKSCGNPGHVFAHDIDPARMKDIPDRAARAGLAITPLKTAQLTGKAPFDTVFCDAPCSGSGAWRRAPDGKWSLTRDRLADLIRLQVQILDQAAALAANDGLLIYATCSLLNDENEVQIEGFLSRNPDWKCLKTNRFSPLQGCDGFFSAHLTRSL